MRISRTVANLWRALALVIALALVAGFAEDVRERIHSGSAHLTVMSYEDSRFDGGEALALRGMKKTLQRPSLRALVVEVAEETAELVRRELGAQGFNLVRERTQRRGNEFFLREDSG